jgi:dsRNA-specific ribonuclease
MPFKNFIMKILENRGRLNPKYFSLLLDEEGMKCFEAAFTHPSFDYENNYELYEFIGDSTLNKILVWYIIERFPFLQKPKFVQILARLKINLVSKKTLYKISENLGFWDFIKCSDEIAAIKKKSLLEDVLEAFIGVCEKLINERIKSGAGYIICYNIISDAFKEVNISLKYEDLYDAKTRLKEIFDKNPAAIGKLKYKTHETGNKNMHKVSIISCINNQEIILSTAISNTLLIEAQQQAAETAINILKERGIMRMIPEIYKDIQENL